MLDVTTRCRRQRIARMLAANPPVVIRPPLLLDGTFQKPGAWYTDIATAPGLTLVILPALWNEDAGPVTAVGQFYDWGNSRFVGEPGVTELLITEDMVGTYIGYVELGTRGSVTTTTYLVPYTPEVLAATLTPAFQLVEGPITGGYLVGDTLTKPTYKWVDPMGLGTGTFTFAGEWYNDKVPTGNTTDTIVMGEGDLLYWVEQATNQFGDTSPLEPWWLVANPASYLGSSQGAVRFASAIHETVRNDMRAEVLGRIAGLPGGATNMNWLSLEGNATAEYEVNPNLWAYDLKHQLSANQVVRIQDGRAGYFDNYGFVMITPRHLLTCAHIGWQSTGNCKSRFLTHEGRTVESHWLAGQVAGTQNGNVDIPAEGTADLQVVTMDRDLTKEGIPFLPIVRIDMGFYRNMLFRGTPTPAPILGLSKSAYSKPHSMWSDYPFDHQRMLYIKSNANVGIASTPEFANYNYELYSGDSGTPTFILVNGRLFIVGVAVTAPFGIALAGSHGPGFSRDAGIVLQQLIEMADARAIAQGKLTAPTGLSPTFVEPEDLFTHPLPPVVNTVATPYRGWFWGDNLCIKAGVNANIRSAPVTDPGTLITTVTTGPTLCTVVEGPEHSEDTWWYRLIFPSELPTGWVKAEYLEAAP